MDRDRRLAFLILKSIESDGSWSNLTVNEYITKQGADQPSFVRELVYGCIRNQILLDYNIKRFLSKPRLSVPERVLLRMGFYQLCFMDAVKDHAAVNETVSIAASFLRGRQGFINAVLRSFQRDGKRLLDDGLSTRYSCEQWIIDLWLGSYGKERAEALLRAGNTPAPLTIRTNTLKISRQELSEKLNALGFDAESCGISSLCLKVQGSGLLDTELYKDGYFSVQGEASCNAVELLCPKTGDVLLDLCAAPGGKSCAAAEMMGDNGIIRSFDIYPHRVQLINKESQRLGISTIQTAVSDSSVFDPELENTADCVIADVPCSGLGTLRRNPEIKLSKHSEADAARMLEELQKIQYNILFNALRYIKSGGKVLYSTCTVDPKENGELVRSVLSDHPSFSIDKEQQLFTTEGGPDGFYSCIIRRTDDKRRFQDR